MSLRDGRVTVLPKEGASLDAQRILKATYDSGVSVAEMSIVALGQVEQKGDGWALRVSPQQVFDIVPNAAAERLREEAGSGKQIRVRGSLFRKPAGAGQQKEPPRELKLEIQ